MMLVPWLLREERRKEFFAVAILMSLTAFTDAITSVTGDTEEIQRISGGEVMTNLSGWEFIAAIRAADESLCSGVIISANYTLTTCHCADSIEHATNFRGVIPVVVAGVLDVSDKNDRRGQWRSINETIRHPHCMPETRYLEMSGIVFDYAVVNVQPAFLMGRGVATVVLPSWDQRTFERTIVDLLDHDAHCEVAGWGKTVVSYPLEYASPSNILLKMTLQLMTWEKCATIICHGAKDKPYCDSSVILSGKFCATPIGPGNSCKRDEGGPLVCDGAVFGMVSFIKSCGERNEPNFYARLDIALPFIRKYGVGLGARTVRSNIETLIAIFLLSVSL